MASLKELKRRLRSVRNTQKITYAMKLVSAAKLRRAQEAATQSRAYTLSLALLLAQILREQDENTPNHLLTERRKELRRIQIIIIGGSRGLCGGYNTHINRATEALVSELREAHPEAELEFILFGKKPVEYFERLKREYRTAYEDLHESPRQWPLEELMQETQERFVAGELDEVQVIYTAFHSALSVHPAIETLLPLEPHNLAYTAEQEALGRTPGVMLFEPSRAAVYEALMPRILMARLLQGALEAKASEHGSRMTAMDSATNNAQELTHELQLSYNKLRQSGITSELLDIIGGAEALQ